MATRKKSTPKSDHTRAQIIEGALQALEQTGVLRTTTRQIATAAGVPLAALHYHFENKSALLVAVLEALNEQIAERVRSVSAVDGTDLDTCISQLLHNSWRAISRTRSIQIVQYELTLYALREGAEWLAERQYDTYVRFYRDALMAGRSKSQRISSANCTLLARFIFAGLDGLTLQELAQPSPERSRKNIDALINAAQSFAKGLIG